MPIKDRITQSMAIKSPETALIEANQLPNTIEEIVEIRLNISICIMHFLIKVFESSTNKMIVKSIVIGANHGQMLLLFSNPATRLRKKKLADRLFAPTIGISLDFPLFISVILRVSLFDAAIKHIILSY